MHNSRPQDQSRSNHRGGYDSSREPESEEKRQLMAALEKFRSMKPYLKKLLKAIKRDGRQLELADTIEDINMYLSIIDDFIADEYHEIDTITGFIEKIQEMMRNTPSRYADYELSSDDEVEDGRALSSDSPFYSDPQKPRNPTERGRNDWENPIENEDTRHLANDIWAENINRSNQFMRRSGAESKTLNFTEDLPGEKLRYARGRGRPVNTQSFGDTDMDIGRGREREFDSEERKNNDNYYRNLGRGKNREESSFETFDNNRLSKGRGRGRRNINNESAESWTSEYPDTNCKKSFDNSLFERRPRAATANSSSNSIYQENNSDLIEDPTFENESLSEDFFSPPNSTRNNSSPSKINRMGPTVVPNPNYIPKSQQQPRPDNNPNAFQQSRPDNNPNAFQQSRPENNPNAFQQSRPDNNSIAFQQSRPDNHPNAFQQSRPDNNSNAFQQSRPDNNPNTFQQSRPDNNSNAFQQPRPDNNQNVFQQSMDMNNSVGSQPITAAGLKEAIVEGIKEVLMQQGGNALIPGLVNRVMHIPNINNLLNQNVVANQQQQPNFPHNIPNRMGMGFIPQPNLYPNPGYPPANNFRAPYPNNPTSFHHPQSSNMNFPEFPEHFDNSHETVHINQAEINIQFREKAKNHFYSTGIRIKPGRRDGPQPPPTLPRNNQSFPVRSPAMPTPYRNSYVATNQMVAQPRNLDPRLNRARNNPVINPNETPKNNEVHNELMDTLDPDENEPSTSTKRRVGLIRPKDLPKHLETTRNKVIARLPKIKVDKISKISEFKKQIEKGSLIRLGNNNPIYRKRYQDSVQDTLPKSPTNKSARKCSDDDTIEPQRNQQTSMKNRSRSNSRPRNSSRSRSRSKSTGNARRNSTSAVSNRSEDASEDEQGFRTTGAVKIKFKIPKLNKKVAKVREENENVKLIKAFLRDTVTTSDIEKLKNPKTFGEIAKKLEVKLAEIVAIKKPSSSSTPAHSKSNEESKQKKSTSKTTSPIQRLFQETLHEMMSAVTTTDNPKESTSTGGNEADGGSLRSFDPSDKVVDKRLPKMNKRKGIGYKKSAHRMQISKKVVRKPKSAKRPFIPIPDAKKVAFKKCRSEKNGRQKDPEAQKDVAGDSSSDLPQKRYMTRLQVKMTAKPPRPVRTGWEKWSKKLEKQKKMRAKFGIRFSAWKIKQNLKNLQLKAKNGNCASPKKKSGNIMGPNSIVVNPGLGKIKIECDYLPPTIKAEKEVNFEDETENADMNHMIFNTQVPELPPNVIVDTNPVIDNENVSENIIQKARDLNASISETVDNENNRTALNESAITGEQTNNSFKNNVRNDLENFSTINLENVSTINLENVSTINLEDVSTANLENVSTTNLENVPATNLENVPTTEDSLPKSVKKEENLSANEVIAGSSLRQVKMERDLDRCTECGFVGKDIVFHYVNKHQGSTIPHVSIPEILFKTLKEKNELSSPQLFNISCMSETEKRWPCLYCDERFEDIREFFVHLTAHTGEYHYACSLCCTRYPDITRLTNHFKIAHNLEGEEAIKEILLLVQHKPTVLTGDNQLFAYLCHDCRYFQLFQENLSRHLEKESHSPQEAISIRFYNPQVDIKIKQDPDKIKDEINSEVELLTETEKKQVLAAYVRMGAAQFDDSSDSS